MEETATPTPADDQGGMAGDTPLQGWRDHGKIQRGRNVLVNGASGGVGTFAVQIAKSFGARVNGVCSTRNLDLVHSLGADRVIDYTREDFTTGSDRYNSVLDCHASRPLLACVGILAPTGKYIIVGAPGGGLIAPLLPAVTIEVLRSFTSITAWASEGQRVVIGMSRMRAVTPEAVFLLCAVVSDERFRARTSGRGPANPAVDAVIRDSGFYEYLRVPTAQPTEPPGRLLEHQSRTVEPVTARNIVHFATVGITGAAQRHSASDRTLV